MRIVFLGTSHGYPEPNRKCSGALIEACGKRILIDAGCDVTSELLNRAIPLESVDAIFVTHMHGDHTNGLLPFLEVCTWKFSTVDPEIFLPGDTKAIHDAANAWSMVNGCKLREFKMHEVAAGTVYDKDGIKVTAFATMHIDISYAYLIEAEGKRVLFSGDLCHKGPKYDFPMSVLEKPLDAAICEAAHFEATDYLPMFENNENLKALYFNHYSARRTKSVYDVREKLKIPVTVLCDGSEIRL